MREDDDMDDEDSAVGAEMGGGDWNWDELDVEVGQSSDPEV